MADRIRRGEDLDAYSAFFEKWIPELKASQFAEAKNDMIDAVVEHHDPVPGSSPETRAAAILLMQEFIDGMETGTSVNRETLMEQGNLPKNNLSDIRFTNRWARENNGLHFNPTKTSHFTKLITAKNGAANNTANEEETAH